MKIETVKTGSFSMNYLRFGQGKQALVILPGLSVQSVMGSAEAIAAAYQLLTKDFTLYVLDRRNELPEDYTLYDMAEDTAQALQALGLDRVCLFGASQGGMMAMHLAIEHPALVRRLILGSTTGHVTQEQLSLFQSWTALAKAGKAAELYLAMGKALYPEPLFEQSRELLKEMAKTVTAEELRRFVILAQAMDGFDDLDRLGSIACPVLVIGSRDDRVVGGGASLEIAEHLMPQPDHVLFLYDSYGHAAYDTAPDYRERMLRFLVPQSN